MSAEGKFTDSGRTWKARAFRGESLTGAGTWWVAIGVGTWSDKANPPDESQAAVGLTAEYARKRVTKIAYLQLDNTLGTLTWRGNKYKEVAGPTPIVAFFGEFADGEIIGATICEEALFTGDVVTNPTSLTLALAAEVVTPGTCVWVRNRPISTKANNETYLVVCFDDNTQAA